MKINVVRASSVEEGSTSRHVIEKVLFEVFIKVDYVKDDRHFDGSNLFKVDFLPARGSEVVIQLLTDAETGVRFKPEKIVERTKAFVYTTK